MVSVDVFWVVVDGELIIVYDLIQSTIVPSHFHNLYLLIHNLRLFLRKHLEKELLRPPYPCRI